MSTTKPISKPENEKRRRGERHISVTRKTYDKLARDLPRNAAGNIRPGALRGRVEQIINAALDKEEAHTP